MIDFGVFLWVATFFGTKVAFLTIAYIVWRDEHKRNWIARLQARRARRAGVAAQATSDG